MKTRFLLALLLATATALLAQPCPDHPQCSANNFRTWCPEDFPRLQGVGIDSTLSTALETLGTPKQKTSPHYDDAFDTTVVRLGYAGLQLEAIKQGQDTEFTISRIEVRTPGWRFDPGPWVGGTYDDVVGALGVPDARRLVGATEVLTYYLCPSDVSIAVSLQESVVVEVLIWFDWI